METVYTKALKLLKNRLIQVLLVLGLVMCLILVSVYSTFNNIRGQGVDKETALTAQYLSNQNELSTFISTFYEQVGIADRNSEQLNTVLTDALKGRYEDTSIDAGTPGEGSQLISAMIEAYPDMTGLTDKYGIIMDTISSGREAYKNDQDRLLDMLRVYDAWRNRGIISSIMIDISGFPSSSLRAQVGETSVTGQAALDKMYQIVLTSKATKAYETGTLDPLELPALNGE